MDTGRIGLAAEFAARAHRNAVRKGEDIPYIAHPVEAAFIAAQLTDNEDVVIAALLHDVVEDAGCTPEDIRERFGEAAAGLVAMETEDKMRDIPAEASWKLRKQAALEHIKNAPREAKIVCLADKLSNMRLSARTYQKVGDAMWERFNQKDKREQEWYYRGMAESLKELKDTDAYREYVSLCDAIFGKKD